MSPTDVHEITNIDDPRLAPYRDLPRRDGGGREGHFVVEGELLVRRLLASPLPVDSILVTPGRLERLVPLITSATAVYVAPNALLRRIVGYPFHAGVLGCARRPEDPPLDVCIGSTPAPLLVACPRIDNQANLGSLMRVAAALGGAGMLIAEGGADPFHRQAMRVSMGAALSLPVRRCADLLDELRRLMGDRGFRIVAAVTDADAVPLHMAPATGPLVLLFGNEAQGLEPAYVALAHQRVRIPMHRDTDSLNVAVAAAVMLYHFRPPT